MSPAEVSRLLQRLENKYKEKYGIAFTVNATPARENSIFAFGVDLSKCIGCRRCVSACTKENNNSRDIQVQYIRVVRMPEGEIDFNNVITIRKKSLKRVIIICLSSVNNAKIHPV
jgi:molybdopterin-containing oxidoreductase family iron-sulfur binding subunit